MFSRVGGTGFNSGYPASTQGRQNQSQRQSSGNDSRKDENIFATKMQGNQNLPKQSSFGDQKNTNPFITGGTSNLDDGKKLAALEKALKNDANYQKYLQEHPLYGKTDSLKRFSASQSSNASIAGLRYSA